MTTIRLNDIKALLTHCANQFSQFIDSNCLLCCCDCLEKLIMTHKFSLIVSLNHSLITSHNISIGFKSWDGSSQVMT